MASVLPPSSIANQYYPLPNRQKTSGASSARNAAAVNNPFAFAALLDSDRISRRDDSGLDVAVLVDLSPIAQDYLDFFNGVQGGISNNTNGDIVLTDIQQAQINAIITQYKDAPFNVETYKLILTDLRASNLAPEQLAAQNFTNPFAGSQIFLNALDEDSTVILPSFNTLGDQANKDAYLRLIFSEWQRISNNFSPFLIANFIENPDARRKRGE